mmetsp:Transcript_35066/g.76747  ORF Transcript_35066/g.76747 Transcript_35066/m.76747 type:complete len:214 (+) Transcript_35066:773-1414(+)
MLAGIVGVGSVGVVLDADGCLDGDAVVTKDARIAFDISADNIRLALGELVDAIGGAVGGERPTSRRSPNPVERNANLLIIIVIAPNSEFHGNPFRHGLIDARHGLERVGTGHNVEVVLVRDEDRAEIGRFRETSVVIGPVGSLVPELVRYVLLERLARPLLRLDRLVHLGRRRGQASSELLLLLLLGGLSCCRHCWRGSLTIGTLSLLVGYFM